MAGLQHGIRTLSIRIRTRPALVAWAVLVALLAVGTVLLWRQDHRHQEVEAARLAAIESVPASVAAILSYDAASVDDDLTAAQEHLTGDFKDEFGVIAHEVVAPSAKQDNVTVDAAVVASSVVKATSTKVVALVYVSQTTTGKGLHEPAKTGSRLRVSLTKVDGKWLVSNLEPV